MGTLARGAIAAIAIILGCAYGPANAVTWTGEVSAGSPAVPVTGPGTTSDSSAGALAEVIGTQTPFPSITATGQVTSGIGASAVAQFQYFVEIVSAGSGTAPLGYVANASVSSTSAAEAFVFLRVDSADTYVQSINGVASTPSPSQMAGLSPGFDPASFTIRNTLPSVPVNTLLEVLMCGAKSDVR